MKNFIRAKKQKNIYPKLFLAIIFFVGVVVFSYHVDIARATNCVSSNTNYCLLAPLGTATSVDTTSGVGTYFNTLIHVFIGLLSVLAVVMIIVGGIQYMIGSTGGEKAGGKEKIENALYGLILALASYLILYTINPKLVNLQLGVPAVSLTMATRASSDTPEGAPTGPVNTSAVYCPKSGGRSEIAHIASSMVGNVTYRAAGDGDCPAGQICTDCSGWTSLVLTCAGLTPGGGTSQMFAPATTANTINSTTQSGGNILVNGIPLKDGDVVGWKRGDWAAPPDNDPNGHALLFVGGMLYENHGGVGRQAGKGVRSVPYTVYDEGGTFGDAFTGIYRPGP